MLNGLIPFFAGAAYVFSTSDWGLTWTARQRLVGSDGGSQNQLGYALAVHGHIVVVGELGNDNANGMDAGWAIYGTHPNISSDADRIFFVFGQGLSSCSQHLMME